MELTEARKQIDAIDDELTALFCKRMELARSVAEYKKENGLPVFQSGREQAILARVSEQAGQPLAASVRALYATLFDLSRAYQHRLMDPSPSAIGESIRSVAENTPAAFPKEGVIACQGVEGAYSSLACKKLFDAPQILYFRSFDGVFQAVEQGLCTYGILPIENSLHGSVGEVYDKLRQSTVSIVRSVKLPISHTLLALPGVAISDIREIVSHEQAIGQCSDFLRAHPEIRVTLCENTASAAKWVAASKRRDLAAIASGECAAIYGLAVINDHLQNADANFTRFLCIAKKPAIYPGANRISLSLSLPHEPGSLYRLLSRFAALGLNLCKLESRPIPGKDFEFLFYFDFESSILSDEVLALIDTLAKSDGEFRFLGCYREIVSGGAS